MMVVHRGAQWLRSKRGGLRTTTVRRPQPNADSTELMGILGEPHTTVHGKGLELSLKITALVDHRPPSHISKTVLSTVHVGGPEKTRTLDQ